jgi:phosphoglycolate phosphatase
VLDAILFDLDGTLVDSAPGIEYSMRCAVAATGVAGTIHDVRTLVGPPVRAMFERALGPMPSETLDALEREFRSSYDATGWQQTRACAHAASTLEALPSLGVRAFVVTNKPAAPTGRILARLGLHAFCSGVVCLDSVSPPFGTKTDVVRYTMRHFGLVGPDTLVVGDSMDDARAAEACGVRFVAMSSGYGRADRQAEAPVAAVCAALSELVPLVKAWRESREVGCD